MKTVLGRFFSSLPLSARVLVLLYAVGYPLQLLGHYTHAFNLLDWLAFSPALLWHGEVWCAITYAFLPNGIVDWAVSLFWLATLASVLGRDWSGRQLWTYCLLTTIVAALALGVFKPSLQDGIVGNAAMIFGLLAAWYRLYGSERLILLGIGELSVRQAVLLIAAIEALVLLFCLPPVVVLAMLCGGAAGWLYLVILGRRVLSRRSVVVKSERVARLEL